MTEEPKKNPRHTVPDTTKKKLQDIGAWEDFKHYRMILIYLGWGTKLALEYSLKGFHPYIKGLKKFIPGKTKVRNLLENIPRPGQIGEEEIPKTLRGKKCPIRDTIQWVGENLDVKRPTAKGCPSQLAWTLLITVGNDPPLRKEFVKKLIDVMAQKGTEGPDKVDIDNLKIDAMVGSMEDFNKNISKPPVVKGETNWDEVAK